MTRVAFLGPPGTFGEEAAMLAAPGAEHVPYPSHAAVATAVETGAADLGTSAEPAGGSSSTTAARRSRASSPVWWGAAAAVVLAAAASWLVLRPPHGGADPIIKNPTSYAMPGSPAVVVDVQ